MELCRCNLKTFMMVKSTFFSRKSIEPMCETEYFVSWWILRQIIECIDYIHDKSIIHSNLNPGNILISTNNNGRFIKLGEFSTSMKVNIELNQSANIETFKHDIFNLGQIALELFGIERRRETSIEQLYDGTNLEKYMMIFHAFIKNCIIIHNNEKQSVKQILTDMKEYSINDKITNLIKDDLLGLFNEYMDNILISTSTELTRQFKKIRLESNLIYKDEDKFSEFTICENIGNGNFGKVIKVRHNVTKKYYAVKKIYINGKTYLP